jgi:hypothetical protein
MKHWLPPTAILVLILIFCLWDGIHMRHETDRWCRQLQQAEELAVSGDWRLALQELEHSHLDWQAHQIYVHSVSPRDTVDDTEAMYHRAKAFAKTKEITEFRAELSDLRDQMRVLSDLESFSYHSIF